MKNNTLLFSIVIPIYKRRKFTTEAIESILNQKGIDNSQIEIIISDDEDQSSIQKENKSYYQSIDKSIAYLTNKHGRGPGGNRQTGLEASSGKYIVFLDSDDLLKSNFLHQMENTIQSNKCVATICFSTPKYESNFKYREKIRVTPLMLVRDFGLTLGYLFNSRSVTPSSFYLCQMSHMMFERKIIAKCSFDHQYQYGGEDWSFITQSMEVGEIRIVPKRLLYFRYSPSSFTGEKISKDKKWDSYRLLLRNMKKKYKRGVFYYLFLEYIKIYGK